MTTEVVKLTQGPIRYREWGEGEPVVFVHGYLVDGRLWEECARSLARAGHRSIAPDWPLGSHAVAMSPDADLSPPGIAATIADFLDALGIERATIVGNDSGGAISQILTANHPGRVERLVLTNCDTFENFPPKPFNLMTALAKVPGAMTALGLPFRIAAARRAAFRPFAKRPVPDELVDSWLAPSQRDRGVRRDLRKVTVGLHKRHTLAAAERLRSFERPIRFAWAPEDRLFKLADAKRLAAIVPDAELTEIADAKTFVPFDQPQAVAEAIASFVSETPRAAAA